MPFAARLKVMQVVEVEYLFNTQEEADAIAKAMHEPGFVGMAGSRISEVARAALKEETDTLLAVLPAKPSSSVSSA
jgi:hypothetical protein